MIDDERAQAHLHDDLRFTRQALLWKLDGLSPYDIRRPLTATGTNLLGVVEHTATWEARYLGRCSAGRSAAPLAGRRRQ